MLIFCPSNQQLRHCSYSPSMIKLYYLCTLEILAGSLILLTELFALGCKWPCLIFHIWEHILTSSTHSGFWIGPRIAQKKPCVVTTRNMVRKRIPWMNRKDLESSVLLRVPSLWKFVNSEKHIKSLPPVEK